MTEFNIFCVVDFPFRRSNFKNYDDPSLFTERMLVKHGP